jgi:hypothetical protein
MSFDYPLARIEQCTCEKLSRPCFGMIGLSSKCGREEKTITCTSYNIAGTREPGVQKETKNA